MAPPRDGSHLRVALGVVGLLLLAVPGFAVGLLVGVVWREPELVASHLFGGTREVEFGGPATAPRAGAERAPGDVAAAPPPAPAPSARPAGAAPAPAAASAKAPQAAAAAPPPAKPAERPTPLAALESAAAGRLAVQVGSFADAASAEKLAGQLRRKGFPAFVSPSTGEAGGRWRVRVGPIASREEADRTAARLKAEERLPTWVVEEGRS